MTSDGPDPSAGRLSEDFRHSIETLFLQGEQYALDDIAKGVVEGKAWPLRFRDEFEAAVRDHLLTPPVWMTLTDRGDDFGEDIDSDWNDLDLELREIWHALAPSRPFPWDEPGHPTPYPPDHPTELGFPSIRLAYTIKRLVNNGNPSLLDRAIRMGIVPHLPPLLERAVQEEWFTPEIWAWMGYQWGSDPSIVTAEVLDRDLRRVWSAVFPERPYPHDAEQEHGT